MNGIAVIGLGSMGYGMAATLAKAGHAVVGVDTRQESVERFRAEFGRAETSVAVASRGAAVLLVVVVNADQAEAVLLGPEGAVAASAPDATVICCVTMAPDRARRLAAAVEAMGRHYVDAPISGGATKAAQGALTILASGAPAAMAKASDVMQALADKVYALGDRPGEAAAFKMINQLLAGVHIAAACEAMILAHKLGLDLHKVFEVITAAAGNSWMFENRVPHILDGDYSPRSAVSIFTKDLGIIADMSRSEQFPTPIAASALQIFLMTAAAGMAGDDDASVARLYARIAGLDLPTGGSHP